MANQRKQGPRRKGGGPAPGGAGKGIAAVPRWLRDEVNSVAPKANREPVLHLLAEGSDAFGRERYRAAISHLERAKELASRSRTVRELLGLSYYHDGRWQPALRELRTYRRLAGETTHMPVEMDCLRALGRPGEVDKAWQLFQELGGSPAVRQEARVVYASHLLDEGKAREAWRIADPGRLVRDPGEEDLRLWYVAARVASALGDRDTAAQILAALTRAAPDFGGLEQLAAEVAAQRPDSQR